MQVSRLALLAATGAALAACGGSDHPAVVRDAAAAEVAGTPLAVRDSTIGVLVTATGTAEPIASATVSTRLMGTVLEVPVREGDRVAAGALLARIDARDLEAKRAQVRASLAAATAAHTEAALMAQRMRALYADSAAAKVQLDAAESGLARAEAAVAAARASEAEVDALADYAVVRAPFAGLITARHVDPGAFAAPGAPLVSIQDDARLRISVAVSPAASAGVRRGSRINATVEGVPATATVEGIVPAGAGSLFHVNALVENRDRSLLAGGAATLDIPAGTRRALLIPAGAVRREGSLTGVTLARGAATRWVTLGQPSGEFVEVLSGLTARDTILVPATARGN